MVSFALLEQVWKEDVSYGQGKGKGLSGDTGPGSGPRKRRHGKKTPSPASRCQKGSAPLCELYTNGFSTAVDDIMDTYTSVSDFYDKTPHSRN